MPKLQSIVLAGIMLVSLSGLGSVVQANEVEIVRVNLDKAKGERFEVNR
jgi:hypothetical protein